MSKENLALHRQGYDAWNRHDRETFLAVADPDVELKGAIMVMEAGGPMYGHEGADRLWDAGTQFSQTFALRSRS